MELIHDLQRISLKNDPFHGRFKNYESICLNPIKQKMPIKLIEIFHVIYFKYLSDLSIIPQNNNCK